MKKAKRESNASCDFDRLRTLQDISEQINITTIMDDYLLAADILSKLRNRAGSVKSLCLAPRVHNKKKVYALVCQTLKLHDLLSKVITQTSLLTHEPHLNIDLALVLTHDLLFARRGVMCGEWVKATMMRHRTDLRCSLSKFAQNELGIDVVGLGHAKIASAVSNSVLGTQPANLPRYVRVNTLKTSVGTVVAFFKAQDNCTTSWIYGGVLHDWKELQKGHFYQDPHLSELLVFPHATDFHLNPLYLDGRIILQDKASAFPAHILSPPPGSHCVDACSAPGNKTTHLAAILSNQGSITAYDLDSRRLQLVSDMSTRSGCTIVTPVHADFLRIDPSTLTNVTHVLVDPSCSGSGIVSRLDHIVDTLLISESGNRDQVVNKENRLHALADFQTQCVLHAMQFPDVLYVCYSTCSVNDEENENVVARILNSQSDFTLSPKERVLPSWRVRGHSGSGLSIENAERLIRSSPDHGTNGFFVSLFERRQHLPTTDSITIPSKSDNIESTMTMNPQGLDKNSPSAETVDILLNKAKIEKGKSRNSKKRKNRKHKNVSITSKESGSIVNYNLECL